MNEKRKTRDERKLVVIMVVVFSAVSLVLLYIGASQIGISLSMIQKIAIFPSSGAYLVSYGFFFTGVLGITFIIFLSSIYFSPDRNTVKAVGSAGIVLGFFLILFAIYSGFVFAVIGGFVLGASIVMTIYTRDT